MRTEGSIIRYAVGRTPIGKVFLALSERGLCTLKLIGRRQVEEALDEVRRLFPRAELREAPRALQPILRQVNLLLDGKKTGGKLTLDMRGTPFQQRVWRALREIPSGTTCSYSELAARVGNLRAVRAVASACARNPVAILVPCHRVVRSDGSLGGYSGGLSFKKELLRRERALSAVRSVHRPGKGHTPSPKDHFQFSR